MIALQQCLGLVTTVVVLTQSRPQPRLGGSRGDAWPWGCLALVVSQTHLAAGYRGQKPLTAGQREKWVTDAGPGHRQAGKQQQLSVGWPGTL